MVSLGQVAASAEDVERLWAGLIVLPANDDVVIELVIYLLAPASSHNYVTIRARLDALLQLIEKCLVVFLMRLIGDAKVLRSVTHRFWELHLRHSQRILAQADAIIARVSMDVVHVLQIVVVLIQRGVHMHGLDSVEGHRILRLRLLRDRHYARGSRRCLASLKQCTLLGQRAVLQERGEGNLGRL